MKITVGKALDAYIALQRMTEEKVKVSPVIGLQMIRLRQMLKNEADSFAQAEQDLVEEYSQKDEIGKIKWQSEGRFQIKSGLVEEYLDKLKELRSAEIDICFQPLSLKGEDIKIDLDEIDALNGLIIFEG